VVASEALQRFADWRAAHVEGYLEVGLAHHVTGCQVEADDQSPNLVVCTLGEREGLRLTD
jgi:hypothetical protein